MWTQNMYQITKSQRFVRQASRQEVERQLKKKFIHIFTQRITLANKLPFPQKKFRNNMIYLAFCFCTNTLTEWGRS